MPGFKQYTIIDGDQLVSDLQAVQSAIYKQCRTPKEVENNPVTKALLEIMFQIIGSPKITGLDKLTGQGGGQ